jgi:hypothetical protein
MITPSRVQPHSNSGLVLQRLAWPSARLFARPAVLVPVEIAHDIKGGALSALFTLSEVFGSGQHAGLPAPAFNGLDIADIGDGVAIHHGKDGTNVDWRSRLV